MHYTPDYLVALQVALIHLEQGKAASVASVAYLLPYARLERKPRRQSLGLVEREKRNPVRR